VTEGVSSAVTVYKRRSAKSFRHSMGQHVHGRQTHRRSPTGLTWYKGC